MTNEQNRREGIEEVTGKRRTWLLPPVQGLPRGGEITDLPRTEKDQSPAHQKKRRISKSIYSGGEYHKKRGEARSPGDSGLVWGWVCCLVKEHSEFWEKL